MVRGAGTASVYSVGSVIDGEQNGGLGIWEADHPLALKVFIRVSNRPIGGRETSTSVSEHTPTLAGTAIRSKHVAVRTCADERAIGIGAA